LVLEFDGIMKVFLPAILLMLIAFSGCLEESQQLDQTLEGLYPQHQLSDLSEQTAIDTCVLACQQALDEGQDLSFGPCLLDPINELPAWVCDIAHSPRLAIDNFPENQCSSFRDRLSTHFVELDPECNFIKAV
jgi:hypothetical protein